MEQSKTEKQNPYNHSKVYKLIDPESGYYYWGSTCNRLSTRLSNHKTDAKKHPDRKVYKAFNEIGLDKVKIILEKEFCLENKEQLTKEENNYIIASIHNEKCLNSCNNCLKIECLKNYKDDSKWQINDLLFNHWKS